MVRMTFLSRWWYAASKVFASTYREKTPREVELEATLVERDQTIAFMRRTQRSDAEEIEVLQGRIKINEAFILDLGNVLQEIRKHREADMEFHAKKIALTDHYIRNMATGGGA